MLNLRVSSSTQATLEQSPIQVLTELKVTWLQWSYENWYFQVDKPLRHERHIYGVVIINAIEGRRPTYDPLTLRLALHFDTHSWKLAFRNCFSCGHRSDPPGHVRPQWSWGDWKGQSRGIPPTSLSWWRRWLWPLGHWELNVKKSAELFVRAYSTTNWLMAIETALITCIEKCEKYQEHTHTRARAHTHSCWTNGLSGVFWTFRTLFSCGPT